MRHQYTRQELESITQETAIYIEGSGIAQLQWGGLEIAQGVKDGYLYCKHIKPFAMDCTANTGRPLMGFRRRAPHWARRPTPTASGP